MARDILIERRCGQTRVAILEEGRLCELYADDEGEVGLTGGVYLGRVANVAKGIEAAFVDIGLERTAFLPLSDVPDEVLRRHRGTLTAGQEIIVQIAKETAGQKGVRLTGHPTLTGRYVCLLTYSADIRLSHRLEDAVERERLRTIAAARKPQGCGLIVRTNAADASEEDIATDIAALVDSWRALWASVEHRPAPALLQGANELVTRVLRDFYVGQHDRIVCEDAETQAALQAVSASMALQPDVQRHGGDTPLFDLYRVDAQFERDTARYVWLKSGAYIVVDYTEAMTVIDVNTGKSDIGKAHDQAILKVNIEAAHEIARQLRLRNLGGIIIVDFIDMPNAEQNTALIEALREAVKPDRVRVTVHGMTELGLVQITRKRTDAPLHELRQTQCPRCHGVGFVDTAATVSRRVLRELDKRCDDSRLTIRCAPDVAQALAGLSCVRDEIVVKRHWDTSHYAIDAGQTAEEDI